MDQKGAAMKVSDLNSISMNGRMAYGILCVETYLMAKYPKDNWSDLSKLMWESTSSYWDEWDNKFIEIIPEYLFEKETYAESEFEHLTEDEYNSYVALFKDKPLIVNTLLMKLHELEEVYCYSSIPGKGKDASQFIVDICNTLEEEGVSLPDLNLVKFSDFSEKNGWGEQFDGSKLSLIINQKEN